MREPAENHGNKADEDKMNDCLPTAEFTLISLHILNFHFHALDIALDFLDIALHLNDSVAQLRNHCGKFCDSLVRFRYLRVRLCDLTLCQSHAFG